MKQDNNTDELLNKISSKMKTAEDDMSTLLAARLQAARKTALEQGLQESKFSIRRWRTAGYVLSSAILLVAGILSISNMQTMAELNIMDDLNLLSANQSIEFYEDIEFYHWLEEAENRG